MYLVTVCACHIEIKGYLLTLLTVVKCCCAIVREVVLYCRRFTIDKMSLKVTRGQSKMALFVTVGHNHCLLVSNTNLASHSKAKINYAIIRLLAGRRIAEKENFAYVYRQLQERRRDVVGVFSV